ncbi:hypothetical protein [uncultured Paraglaciecola sp.]|uniref:hypothetical protein n=1 Tax=uncultured Paraglaciecola sp. TaxID=1765024 RepID=UPI0026366121|nr:hypothetical protein [uncultured Paraglaciecola sp.]
MGAGVAAAMPYVATALTAASGYMQYKEANKAGDGIMADAERYIDEEELRHNEQQISRREKIIKALAAQNAGAGARGISLSGSPINVMEFDQKQYEMESLSGRVSHNMRTSNIKEQARNRASGIKRSAQISLLDTGTRMASTMINA